MPSQSGMVGQRVPVLLPDGTFRREWWLFFFYLWQIAEGQMSATTGVLIEGTTASNAQTTQYTSPTNVTTIVDTITATNYSAGAVTISVNVVASGDTPGNQNLIVKNVSLPAGSTYLFPELQGQVLNPGDYISTIASAAGSINIRASGRTAT